MRRKQEKEERLKQRVSHKGRRYIKLDNINERGPGNENISRRNQENRRRVMGDFDFPDVCYVSYKIHIDRGLILWTHMEAKMRTNMINATKRHQ